MGQSSFLSRWTGRQEGSDDPAMSPEVSPPEPTPPTKGQGQSSVWAVSPSLERICQDLEEQVRVVEEAKRLLEQRLEPFQRHLAGQRRNVDQSLKQLDTRLQPLRQFLEGQGGNLERVGTHLQGELRAQFENFERFLAEQRQLLERATRYLDEQPRPLTQYFEDERRAIEMVFQDLEERLEPLGRYLKELQRLLAAMTEPTVIEEFDVLASFFGERHAALGRYATATEYRPQALFAELDGIYQKYTAKDGGKSRLLTRVLEQARQADLHLQDSLKPLPHEQGDPRPRLLEATP